LVGTTLVELLVAVVFIGICVSALVACVSAGDKSSTNGRRRILMLAQARTEIEKSRSLARAAALSPSVVSYNAATSGFTGSATLSKQTTLISGYTNLYKVTVTISWVERSYGVSRNDSLTLETWMRAPDA
jgi:Tfp pilus assembly protein PilV